MMPLVRALPLLLCACAALTPLLADDQIPPEWGPLWQPQLPAKERHPSLFFGEADRARLLERTKTQPTAYWWKSFADGGYAASPAVKWWLLGTLCCINRCCRPCRHGQGNGSN